MERQVCGDYVIEAPAVECGDGRLLAHVGVTKIEAPNWKILEWHAKAIAFDNGEDALKAGPGRRQALAVRLRMRLGSVALEPAQGSAGHSNSQGRDALDRLRP